MMACARAGRCRPPAQLARRHPHLQAQSRAATRVHGSLGPCTQPTHSPSSCKHNQVIHFPSPVDSWTGTGRVRPGRGSPPPASACAGRTCGQRPMHTHTCHRKGWQILYVAGSHRRYTALSFFNLSLDLYHGSTSQRCPSATHHSHSSAPQNRLKRSPNAHPMRTTMPRQSRRCGSASASRHAARLRT